MMLVYALVLLGSIYTIYAGHILMYPYSHGFTTRLRDTVNFARMFIEEGHQLSILINSKDKRFFKDVKGISEYFEYTPPTHLADYESTGVLNNSFIPGMKGADIQLKGLSGLQLAHCEVIFGKHGFVVNINSKGFDIFFVDVIDSCARILVNYFDIPTAAYSSHGYIFDPSHFPSLPSFIPVPMRSYQSNMDFKDRFTNTIEFWLFFATVSNEFYGPFNRIAQTYGIQKPVEYAFTNRLILIICDPALDYPRPLFSNIKCVGGLNNKPAKPLNEEFETFMESSGEHGVVIVSFGTLLITLQKHKADMIAAALSQLPQKVIWKYKGETPDNVGANIKIVDWIPQNDLLGHPKTNMFVTHCGSHSTFETAYHGVPVIALPVCLDQFDNAKRLVDRAGMGVEILYESLNEENLLAAMKEVLSNKTYKENAMLTSQLLRDRVISPKNEFLFHINYVIRHKGMGKMSADVTERLNTFQLYSIDVMAVVAFVFALCNCIIFYSLKGIFRCLFKNNKLKHE